jgi:hypothetical protein
MSTDPNIFSYEDGPVADHGLRGDPALTAAIEAHIAEHYGPESTVWRHPMPEEERPSPIHIRIVQPTDERPALTLITVGMSERPMVSGDHQLSTELVIVLPPDWSFDEPVDTWPLLALDLLANFPHEYGTLLDRGHTIENPFPWTPSGLIGSLVADQCLAPSEDAEVLVYEGREIRFFGVYFLYADEMQFKLDHGGEQLWDLLVDAGVTETVEPNRASVAPRRRRRGLFRRG